MRDFKGKSLTDRLQNSNKAKQALIQKMREAPKPDAPEVMAQRAAKAALLAANKVERERRHAEKAAAAAPVVAPAPPGALAQATPAVPTLPAAAPWYMHPFVLGAALLVLLGALVLGLRRRKSASDAGNLGN